MSSRLRLLAPLRYLRIHSAEKQNYDFWIPGIVGVGTWVAYLLMEPKPSYFGADGLLVFVKELLIMTVPFLIGSLAAVAMGSPGEKLDKRTAGEPIVLDGKALTLRQFVCYLLGYLCFLSLVILVGVVGALLLQPSVMVWTNAAPDLRGVLGATFSLVLSLLLSSLTVTFLWSLYFLTDVLNRK